MCTYFSEKTFFNLTMYKEKYTQSKANYNMLFFNLIEKYQILLRQNCSLFK